jgi:hypothetical protein
MFDSWAINLNAPIRDFFNTCSNRGSIPILHELWMDPKYKATVNINTWVKTISLRHFPPHLRHGSEQIDPIAPGMGAILPN